MTHWGRQEDVDHRLELQPIPGKGDVQLAIVFVYGEDDFVH